LFRCAGWVAGVGVGVRNSTNAIRADSAGRAVSIGFTRNGPCCFAIAIDAGFFTHASGVACRRIVFLPAKVIHAELSIWAIIVEYAYRAWLSAEKIDANLFSGALAVGGTRERAVAIMTDFVGIGAPSAVAHATGDDADICVCVTDLSRKRAVRIVVARETAWISADIVNANLCARAGRIALIRGFHAANAVCTDLSRRAFGVIGTGDDAGVRVRVAEFSNGAPSAAVYTAGDDADVCICVTDLSRKGAFRITGARVTAWLLTDIVNAHLCARAGRIARAWGFHAANAVCTDLSRRAFGVIGTGDDAGVRVRVAEFSNRAPSAVAHAAGDDADVCIRVTDLSRKRAVRIVVAQETTWVSADIVNANLCARAGRIALIRSLHAANAVCTDLSRRAFGVVDTGDDAGVRVRVAEFSNGAPSAAVHATGDDADICVCVTDLSRERAVRIVVAQATSWVSADIVNANLCARAGRIARTRGFHAAHAVCTNLSRRAFGVVDTGDDAGVRVRVAEFSNGTPSAVAHAAGDDADVRFTNLSGKGAVGVVVAPGRAWCPADIVNAALSTRAGRIASIRGFHAAHAVCTDLSRRAFGVADTGDGAGVRAWVAELSRSAQSAAILARDVLWIVAGILVADFSSCSAIGAAILTRGNTHQFAGALCSRAGGYAYTPRTTVCDAQHTLVRTPANSNTSTITSHSCA